MTFVSVAKLIAHRARERVGPHGFTASIRSRYEVHPTKRLTRIRCSTDSHPEIPFEKIGGREKKT